MKTPGHTWPHLVCMIKGGLHTFHVCCVAVCTEMSHGCTLNVLYDVFVAIHGCTLIVMRWCMSQLNDVLVAYVHAWCMSAECASCVYSVISMYIDVWYIRCRLEDIIRGCVPGAAVLFSFRTDPAGNKSLVYGRLRACTTCDTARLPPVVERYSQ